MPERRTIERKKAFVRPAANRFAIRKQQPNSSSPQRKIVIRIQRSGGRTAYTDLIRKAEYRPEFVRKMNSR